MEERKGDILYYPIFPERESPGAERSDDIRIWVDNFLIPSGRFTLDEEKANAYFIATGDGGMMRTVRTKHMHGKVFVGANRGARGFLMNPISDINRIPVNFNQLDLVDVYLIQGEFHKKDGEVMEYLAFNEIVVGRDVADFIKFRIRGISSYFPNRDVEGNGIIVSTPQGSTGYIIKNRGPLLQLDSKRWYISGILTGPYPDDPVKPQKITIEVEARTPVNGYADGHVQRIEDIEKVVITPTEHRVTLGFLKGLEFEDRRRDLKQKVEKGEI